MVKKQIIGSVLILFALLELFAVEFHRGSCKIDASEFAEEIFYFFIGVFVFLIILAVGALILRKKLLVYWSISWAITSVLVGILALWTFILSSHPTEHEWGALAQSAIYYIIGSLQSQTAIPLAILALYTSRELKDRYLSVVIWFCLIFSLAVFLLYIGYTVTICVSIESFRGVLYSILLNTVPLCVIIFLILFLLKEREVKIINKTS